MLRTVSSVNYNLQLNFRRDLASNFFNAFEFQAGSPRHQRNIARVPFVFAISYNVLKIGYLILPGVLDNSITVAEFPVILPINNSIAIKSGEILQLLLELIIENF